MPKLMSTMHDGDSVVQLLDIARGLNHPHDLGIVHGDVKGVGASHVGVGFE